MIQSIKANYEPKIIFNDIMKRDVKDIPDIDLYVCGFPCQTFSIAGNRKGFDDVRGNVFFKCLEVIKNKTPKYFVLENVKGLVNHDRGNSFKIIWGELQNLKSLGYDVYHKVLNTKDYGIPQNRERIWFIGVLNSKKDFEFPKQKKILPLKDFVDWDDDHKDKMTKILKDHIHKFENTNAFYVDQGFIKLHNFSNQDKYSPCLNTMGQMWNIKLNRFANINEYLLLQGFPKSFKQVVSNNKLKKQIGNSMSVNILEEIFKELFKC